MFIIQVNITFGEKANRQVEKKEVPLWIAESTVEMREEEEAVVASIGPSMAIIEVSYTGTEWQERQVEHVKDEVGGDGHDGQHRTQHGNNLKVALFGAAVATVWRPEAVKWGTAPQHRCGVEDVLREKKTRNPSFFFGRRTRSPRWSRTTRSRTYC